MKLDDFVLLTTSPIILACTLLIGYLLGYLYKEWELKKEKEDESVEFNDNIKYKIDALGRKIMTDSDAIAFGVDLVKNMEKALTDSPFFKYILTNQVFQGDYIPEKKYREVNVHSDEYEQLTHLLSDNSILCITAKNDFETMGDVWKYQLERHNSKSAIFIKIEKKTRFGWHMVGMIFFKFPHETPTFDETRFMSLFSDKIQSIRNLLCEKIKHDFPNLD